ncbi:GH12 family glycosyl hydrolase domain-containing protein [uncultured Cellulomonas sp.]|uniref:GH12 family glycosyl hydrolase domain-containing protein n=1 Tax=uncultured Cellulomonas sp. TaxID=189682 RepID=UPI0028E6F0BC|nr:cellulose binding domain-containing protein [uncultured Cellulomonas sp.]
MTRRSRTVALVALLCSLLGMSGVAAAQVASAAPVLCDQWGSAPIQGGRYTVMNNRWGTSATQCIDVSSTGFTVTQADGSVATNGAPKSYPAAYYGCHYSSCTTNGNILSPNGLQASDPRFATISTSVSMTFPSSGTYDAAYDIWFHRSRPSTTTGQNDGAELMVWLNHAGPIQPIGSKIGTASIAGATWDIWSGSAGWNVISYVRQQPTSSATFLVNDFWKDVVARGLGSTSWYLTSIQAGFEPWVGGAGLTLNSFSVTTDGPQPTQSPTPTSTPTPTPTSGPAGCSATLAVTGSWQGGFQGAVTVKNTGSAMLSRWSVGWIFPSGQTLNNLWNGVASQSGSRVSVANAPYNGLLGAGASTTFGFVGNGAAPGSPTLTCTGS